MFQAAITILPIITGALYCFGVFYNQGFLGGFGIEESLFPISIDRSILQGFLTIVTFSVKPTIYSMYLSGIMFGIASLAGLLSSYKRVHCFTLSFIGKKQAFFNGSSETESISILQDKSAMLTAYLSGIFLIILFFICIVNLSGKSGQELAARFIEEAGKNKKGYVTIYRSNGAQALNGKPIICGSSYCAYWIEKEAVIIRNDTIDKIVISKPNPQTAPATANP